MVTATFLGIAAATLQVVAYGIYARQVIRTEAEPNGTTWLMWSYGTFVFLFIEADIGAPISVLLLPLACTLSAIGISVYSFIKKSYIRPELQDYVALSVDLVLMSTYLMLLYGVFRGVVPEEAHGLGLVFLVLASLSTLTSFYPILRTTYCTPHCEKPFAWFVWTTAYVFLLCTVLLEHMSWVYMIYPILNILLHAIVGLFACNFHAVERPRSP